MTNPYMTVALYARVSTVDRDQDPENQLMRLRQVALDRNYQIFKEYTDFASGSNLNRPALKEMLDDAKRARFDLIMIVRLDRIMRSTIGTAKMLESLEKWNVNLEALDQSIETRTPSGRMITTFFAAVAQYESEVIKERVMDGLARSRAEGWKHSKTGRGPGRKPADVDIEAIEQKLLEGLSLRKAAKILGIPFSTARNALIKKQRGENSKEKVPSGSESGDAPK